MAIGAGRPPLHEGELMTPEAPTRHVPLVRPGGYFVLHDYFGWYDEAGRNNSPIKRVADEIPQDQFPRLLIDTGYPSLVVFRRPGAAD